MNKYLALFAFSLLLIFNSTPAVAQMPSGTSLWLRADQGITAVGNLVTEWRSNDASGARATGIAPINEPTLVPSAINGHPVVRFGGAHLMMCSPVYPVAKDYTLFYVLQLINFSGSINVVSGTTHATYANPTRLLHGDFGTLATAPVALTTAPTLVTVRYNQGSQNASISINGQQGDSAFVGTNLDSTIYLAAYAGGNFMTGDIAEVVLYPRALSAADTRKTEEYLLQRYGITRYVAPPVDTTFTSIPQPRQFYPRDANNGADISVRGYVVAPNADSAALLLYRDQLLIERTSQKLSYTNGSAPFQLNTRIQSELREYRIEVLTVKNGVGTMLAVRDSIVCGDVYLIAGQSNTVFGGVSNALEFVRTYGGTASANKGDTLFSNANASGGGSNIGAFGMRLAELIMQNHAVPVCIINGGVGGTSIEQNSRIDNQPELLTSIYGSMLYRVRKSKFTDKAKALFWYQGESNQVTNYAQNFRKLHTDWLSDYPSLQRVYMVQIRPGCANFASHDLLRDVQRAMQDSLPKLEVTSAVALPGHDGCHYTPVGYTALGNNLFRLVERDFYNSTDDIGVSAPAILRAYFTGTDRTKIAVVFKPKTGGLQIQADVMANNIAQSVRDHIYLDGGAKINSISTSADTIFLHLAAASNASNISYIPAVYYNNTTVVYEGPWIVNARGIGALTFANFPITAKPITQVEDNETPRALRTSMRIVPNPASNEVSVFLPELDAIHHHPTSAESQILQDLSAITLVDALGIQRTITTFTITGNQVSFSTLGIPVGQHTVRIDSGALALHGNLVVVR
ncbi:MAG: hypothetical protein HQ472_06945 [Ignavibacteria bacterium]|nr:hypothetical protein [Ignavibacteria bacterium]